MPPVDGLRKLAALIEKTVFETHVPCDESFTRPPATPRVERAACCQLLRRKLVAAKLVNPGNLTAAAFCRRTLARRFEPSETFERLEDFERASAK